MERHESETPNRSPEELSQNEQHFLEVTMAFGGIAVLEFFDIAEKNGKGAVAGAGEEDLQAMAIRDGENVHVQYSREVSFNLPYPRAKELAKRVAIVEMREREAKKKDPVDRGLKVA